MSNIHHPDAMDLGQGANGTIRLLTSEDLQSIPSTQGSLSEQLNWQANDIIQNIKAPTDLFSETVLREILIIICNAEERHNLGGTHGLSNEVMSVV